MESYDKKYKLIMFDLDGTLLDTLGDLTEAVNYAMRELGYPEYDLDHVRSFVGNGNRKLMERCILNAGNMHPQKENPVPEGDLQAHQAPADIDSLTEEALRLFHSYYSTHYAVKTVPYPGIPELLSELKAQHFSLAVISNKADYAVQKICSTYFNGIFDLAIGDREDLQKKPAPDPVFYTLNSLQISAEQSLYVGDSEVDIQTASNAGVRCISVDWGFRPREILVDSGAETILSQPLQLLSFFR